VPFLPLSEVIAPIAAMSWLAVDVNKGTISGYVSHTQFPSFQLFVNGQPVYYNKESANPDDIRGKLIKAAIDQKLCDPSK
jgi:hypothetical protein